jgi:LacI family transcriptional regulator
MSVSIYDIAKEANVSPSTVSRALQDHPRIGAETKVRIQTLAKNMGYVPSAVAKSLTTNKTWTIGMVITTVADPVVADIMYGVEEVAQGAGYSVFLSNSRNDPWREVAVVETFQRRRVDAVIDVASRMGSTYSSKLNQLQVPIVLVENQERNDYHYTVSTDSKGGGKAATDHLIGLGHRRIGFVGAIDRPKSNDERLTGYKTALKQANIPLIPELITLPESDDDFERGQLGLAEILAAEPTAIFCYNDRTAIGLMKGCEHRDIAIPQQLSIVGFDDIRTASYLRPALTTIRQPRVQMGQIAMRMTLDLLGGQTPENRILPVKLIVRQTTARI